MTERRDIAFWILVSLGIVHICGFISLITISGVYGGRYLGIELLSDLNMKPINDPSASYVVTTPLGYLHSGVMASMAYLFGAAGIFYVAFNGYPSDLSGSMRCVTAPYLLTQALLTCLMGLASKLHSTEAMIPMFFIQLMNIGFDGGTIGLIATVLTMFPVFCQIQNFSSQIYGAEVNGNASPSNEYMAMMISWFVLYFLCTILLFLANSANYYTKKTKVVMDLILAFVFSLTTILITTLFVTLAVTHDQFNFVRNTNAFIATHTIQ